MEPPSPRVKLWVESDRGLVLSDYRIRLLELVAASGSLAQAAQELGLSYRRAWGKVKELEANLGTPLVQSEVGGSGGGHSILTSDGQAYVEAFRRFQRTVEEATRAAYRETLRPLFGVEPGDA